MTLFGAFLGLQGLCQSTGWAPLSKNVSRWFSLGERGRTMGWWATNYSVGALLGPIFAGFVADALGSWRYAFFGPAAASATNASGVATIDTSATKKGSVSFTFCCALDAQTLDTWPVVSL